MSLLPTRILAIDLFPGIWSHTLLTNKTLQALNLENVVIDYLTCGSAFTTHCTVKESKKRAIGPSNPYAKLDCADCEFSGFLSSRHLKNKGVNVGSTPKLSDFVDFEILGEERAVLEECIEPIQLEYHLHGTPVVKFALFETVIKYKKLDLRLSGAEGVYFRSTLENVIRTTLVARRFLALNRPDFAICHTPEYGANNAFVDQCMQAGIKTFAITNSSNLSEMTTSVVLWDYETTPGLTPGLRSWSGVHNFKEEQDDRSRLDKHFRQIALANSPFVYSEKAKKRPPDQIRLALNLPAGSKIIVLALSSTDEVVASKLIGRNRATNYPGKVFKDQFEWVAMTLEKFKEREDVVIVVRLHPRDLPNKREKIKSEQFDRWQGLLSNLPRNVRVNLPEQKIAFGDLCQVTDVLVTGWSSVALEAMMLGIPAVTYDRNLPGYPDDVHFSGESRKQYFSNIELALQQKISPDETRNRARNWLAHYLNHGSILLSGRLFEKLRMGRSRTIRIFFSALDRYLFWIWRVIEIKLTPPGPKDSGARIRSVLLGELGTSYTKATKAD